jgi:hypothetical protein
MRLLTRQLRLHTSLKRAQYSTYRGTGYCIETKTVIKAVLWIRTAFIWSAGSGSALGIRIRIRIQEGQNDPQIEEN